MATKKKAGAWSHTKYRRAVDEWGTFAQLHARLMETATAKQPAPKQTAIYRWATVDGANGPSRPYWRKAIARALRVKESDLCRG